MEEHFYIEKYSLIISTNDKYNNLKGEYEVIPNTIKNIISYLSTNFNLYNYYKDYYKNKENIENFVVLKKILTREIVVFEPFNLDILNDEYIMDLNIIGLRDNNQLHMNELLNKEFSDINDVRELLLHKNQVVVSCQVYDSNYIEVISTDFEIIARLKDILL
ncbi:phosphate transporter [Cytobacillus kochii]